MQIKEPTTPKLESPTTSAQGSLPVLDGAPPFQLWESSGNQVVAGETQYLNHNIASSLALYTYLARSIDRCKGEAAMEFFMSSLNKLVPRVCSYIEVVVQGSVRHQQHCD